MKARAFLETCVEGPWSPSVSDNRGYALRGRLVLRIRSTDGGRARETAVFLDLQDVSRSIHSGMRIFCDLGRTDFRPEYIGGLRCILRDRLGHALPSTPIAFGGAAPSSLWVELPAEATIRLRTSPFAGGKSSALVVFPDLVTRWELPERNPDPYFLSGVFTVAPKNAPLVSDPQVWRGTLDLPPLRLSGRSGMAS
jgi:hypothetical protein